MATRSQLLNINSANRVSGTPYDFFVNITNGLVMCEKHETMKMIVIDCCINKSWYTIDSSNNSFLLKTVRVGGGYRTVPYTIPVGYYDVLQLRYELSVLLVGWTIAYSSTTNTYTYTPPNNGDTYTLFFQNNACELMGFNITETPSGSYSSAFTSSIPIKVNLENAVCVHCDVSKVNNACVDNFSGQGFVDSDLLIKIPIQSDAFQNIVYQSQGNDNISYDLSLKCLHTMRLWVTDENQRPLQLPYDWTICLKIEFDRETDLSMNDMVEDIKDDLRLIVLSQHMH